MFIMAPLHRESALSEVIGFILIVALITIIISLYALYVVPAQGRDEEIEHMNLIGAQFSNYRMSVDNLWKTNLGNGQLITTFPLGDRGMSSSSGSFLSFPLLQPAGSAGALLINKRNDSYTLAADALMSAEGQGNQTPEPVIISEPAYLYINFSTRQTTAGTANPSELHSYGISVIPVTMPGEEPYWSVRLNATPRILYGNASNVTYITDLTITVVKNRVKTLDNLVISENIRPDMNYTVDILDESYGLRPVLKYPLILSFSPDPPVRVYSSIGYGYQNNPIGQTMTMGSLEFRSANNYFIQQNYYYQFGGVFLDQQDGMVSRQPPGIVLSKQDNQTMDVSIVELIIIGDGIIGGSAPVQVQTQVTTPIRPYQLASGYPNARSVDVTIGTDPRSVQMWNNTLDRIRVVASRPPYNVPLNWSTLSNTTNSVTLHIDGVDPDPAVYDIRLDVQRIYLFTSFQRIGTVLE